MTEERKAKTYEEHRKQGKKKLRIGVITVSDSKFNSHWKKFFESSDEEKAEEDISGSLLCEKVRKSGNELAFYAIVPDNREMIIGMLKYLIEDKACDAVIITGGTGLTARDVTIEAVRSIAEKHIPGFGEIFRAESYKKIGSPAILSRAEAAIFKGSAVFSLPGSPEACETGFKIIEKELGHIIKHARS